ncbi:MAG: OmpA family protein [Flavobacteriales bacterium]|nr:OmpA family protein [Flavobacteriales bacterium]MDW8431914.1 OmpA family protein [Flavobacteriales bacterium]
MKSKISILGLILPITILFVSWARAQNVEFKKQNFPQDPEGFRKAYEALTQGDEQLSLGPSGFEKALRYYLEAYRFNPNNADLNYKLGIIYNALGLKGEAAEYYDRAGQLDNKYKKEAQKLTAELLHLDYQWDRAAAAYADYIATLEAEKGNTKDKARIKEIEQEIYRLRHAANQCKNGKEICKDTIPVAIINLGRNINSRYPDYSGIFTENFEQIFFTSRRPNTTGGGIPPGDVFYFEDIYYTFKDSTGNYVSARQVPGKINTPNHDATVAITSDGKRMIICRPKSATDSDLFEATFNGTEWSDARPLEGINSKYRETHATFLPDRKTILFVSNDPDKGARGLDIFMATFSEAEGKYVNIRPVNELNTEWNEDAVFMDFDGNTLYFASEGHTSMGGYDFFKSTYSNGVFSKPVNLGYPINSPGNDVFFVVSRDGKTAIFDSNRRGGFGEKDLYRMSFLDKLEMVLFGTVYDTKTKQVIRDAKIKLINTEDQSPLSLASNVDPGNYFTREAKVSKFYKAQISANGYQPYEEVFKTVLTNLDSLQMRKDFYLEKAIMLTLKGSVIDVNTNKKVSAKIELQRTNADEKKTLDSDPNTGYQTTTSQGASYNARVEAQGYPPVSESFTVNLAPGQTVFEKNFYVSKVTVARGIRIFGTIFDRKTNEKLNGTIKILDEKGKEILTLNNSAKTGYSTTELKTNTVYFAVVNSDGYNTGEERFEIIMAEGQTEYEKNFYLEKPFSEKLVAVKNIYFDFDKYNLRPDALRDIQKVLKILQDDPNSKVEMFAHCDIIGTYEYNVQLSLNRALTAYNWLYEHGISKDRMKYSYYSFTKPAAPNTKADGSDNPEGRQLNRRVEFRIYEMSSPQKEVDSRQK